MVSLSGFNIKFKSMSENENTYMTISQTGSGRGKGHKMAKVPWSQGIKTFIHGFKNMEQKHSFTTNKIFFTLYSIYIIHSSFNLLYTHTCICYTHRKKERRRKQGLIQPQSTGNTMR